MKDINSINVENRRDLNITTVVEVLRWLLKYVRASVESEKLTLKNQN